MAACHTIKAGADSSATGASAPPKIGPLVLSTTLLYLEFSRMFIVPDLSGLVLAPKRKEKRKRKKKKKGKKEERKERKEKREKAAEIVDRGSIFVTQNSKKIFLQWFRKSAMK